MGWGGKWWRPKMPIRPIQRQERALEAGVITDTGGGGKGQGTIEQGMRSLEKRIVA